MNPSDVRRHPPDEVVPQLLARTFANASPLQRRRLLETVLRGVGPLAMTVLGAGAFARFLQPGRWQHLQVSLDDAMRVSQAQVLALARHAWQREPETFAPLLRLLMETPGYVQGLSAGLLILALTRWLPRPHEEDDDV